MFNQNLPNNTATAAAADIAKGQGERQNAFNALRNLTQSNSAPSAITSAPEQSAATRVSTAGNTAATNTNTAQSKLGGYGDWATALGTANQGVNSNLGIINNEARGNAALLPLQIEKAAHKGDSLGMWGKIISLLGTLASGAGGSYSSSLATA